MDTKVIVEFVCPHCKSKIFLKKKKEKASLELKCPDCGNEYQVIFDTSKEPQTYSLESEPPQSKKDKTVYNKNVYNVDNREGCRVRKDDTVYKKERNKTPHSVIDDEHLEEDVVKPKKKKHRLSERIYLTHITWFGLRNQRFQLYEGTTTIGRYDEDELSDISIKGDDSISRKSIAIIIEEDDGIFDYRLKVLNATNPVKVNDQPIKVGSETFLDFGDIILLGNSKFKFDNK